MKALLASSGLMLALLSFAGLPVHAHAQPDDASQQDSEADRSARAHFRLGRAHYENGNFADAAREFKKAYEVSKRPQLLYNLYLAHRDAYNTAQAAEALRQYLALVADAPNRENLEARLEALDRALAEEQAQGSETSAAPPEQPPEPVAEPAPAEQAADTGAIEATANLDDDLSAEPFPVLPVTLMAGGGALLLGSLVTGLMVSSAKGELDDECRNGLCPAELESTRDRGETLAVVTDALWIGGLLTAGAGAALFFLQREPESRVEAGAQPLLACGLDGCGAGVSVSF